MSVDLLISYLMGTCYSEYLNESIEDVEDSITYNTVILPSDGEFPGLNQTVILCL